jgi:hypothetical protein
MQKLALLLAISAAASVGVPSSAVAMHHRHVHSFFVFQTRPPFATQPFFAQRFVFVQRPFFTSTFFAPTPFFTNPFFSTSPVIVQPGTSFLVTRPGMVIVR